ncbi:MAG: exo-alpha-sialidase [Gemmatimonadaceae bacterium]|nr:exo-alpha-sialidase [Gemmatimonadaceae bacterium]
MREPTKISMALLALASLAACDGAPNSTPASNLELGTPVALEAPPADSNVMARNTPHLTLDSRGQVWMSWTERLSDSSVQVRVARQNGSSWDSVRTVAMQRPLFVNWADFPSVAVLPNGDLVAHWLEREGGGKYAYGVRVVRSRDEGRTWSAPITPHTDGLAAEHGFVSLWTEGQDEVGLVWLDGRKSAMPDSAREMTIRSAVIRADGSMRDEALLDARACDCCQTGTAVTGNGRVVVYRDRTAEEIRDIAITRRTASGWTEPTIVAADNWHYPGCPVNGPQAASRGDTVVVAWFAAPNDSARVRLARSVDGGATFGEPVRVDEGNPMGRVDVELAPDGQPVVSWLEQRGADTSEVMVRRVRFDSAGSTMGAPLALARTSSARQSGFPRLVATRDGLVAAWTTVKPSLQVHLVRIPFTSETSR